MLVKTLQIPVKLISDIETLAARDYPKETCGFLVGRWNDSGGQITHVLPAGNQHFADPYHHYQIDPATYRHAEAITAKNGLLLLGVFHSHPDSAPTPSSLDERYAFPEWFYLITPVMKGRCEAPEAWFRSADAKSWMSVIIERI
ncbi:M67 family metallopeptidase [Candidatus Sumerlaeota bacterium]|nr:M67 family metallopeptidase [Candidatus Sumerlaeota bacterium]